MQILGDIGLGFIETLVGGFLFIFQYIAGMLVTLGGGLVNFALDININQLGAETEIIRIGWQVTRDVANLGFVLAIILIALATIVRFKEYGAKKLLPKLIGAALIVNFSLAIAGVFLDFSHTLTDFFINTQMQGYETVGENITAAFGPQKFYTEELTAEDAPPPDPGDSGSSFSGAFLSSILGTVFSIAFTFLTFFTLAALSILLIIRFVYIAVLLIISPIAWLFWVIPGLEGQFKKWWDKFLQWTFFVPAVSFFIYLALVSVDELASNMSAQTVGSGFSGGIANIITQGSQMIIVAGLMIGGLFAAQEMGIKGAKTAINVAESAGGKVKGFARNRAKGLRQRAITAGTKTDDEGETTSTAERLASKASQVPVVGRAFRGTAERIGKQKDDLENQVKGRQEDLSNITNEDLEARASRVNAATHPVEASAIAKETAKRGGKVNVSDDKMETLMDAAETTGVKGDIIKDVTSKRPDKAPKFGGDIADTMSQMSSGKAHEIESESFDHSEVVINLSNSHLGNIGSKGSPEQKSKILDKLNELEKSGDENQKKAVNRIRGYMRENANWQVEEGSNEVEKSNDYVDSGPGGGGSI